MSFFTTAFFNKTVVQGSTKITKATTTKIWDSKTRIYGNWAGRHKHVKQCLSRSLSIITFQNPLDSLSTGYESFLECSSVPQNWLENCLQERRGLLAWFIAPFWVRLAAIELVLISSVYFLKIMEMELPCCLNWCCELLMNSSLKSQRFRTSHSTKNGNTRAKISIPNANWIFSSISSSSFTWGFIWSWIG